ncbi:MAG: replication restart helicase PriA [Eubacteriales bacterium]
MCEDGFYAEVIVEIPTRKLDRAFHYGVPPSLVDKVRPGARVLVPFRGKNLPGYVVGFGSPEKEVNIKDIKGVLDEGPVFTPDLLELARWMSASYLCSSAEALNLLVTPRLKVKGRREERHYYCALAGEELAGALQKRRSPGQAAALKKAVECPGLTGRELAVAAGVSSAVLTGLVKKGLLTFSADTVRRCPAGPAAAPPGDPFRLTAGQEAALGPVKDALLSGAFKTFLLYGVTGSGKTEVYLRSIDRALALGRGAVALVPEIALTPQMVGQFRGRFGDRVAVLHSGLSDGERYDEWCRVQEGTAAVALGTRSAVFAPMPRPGLFIIDEEHEPSYKQEERLRYHAREVAIRRAQTAGGVVVLGSATPSLESFARTKGNGLYELLRMPHRVDLRPMPGVQVIDMRAELKEKHRSLFSRALLSAVNERLKRREQVILFLNRRGFANFVMCRECGLVLKCRNCDISLTYHADGTLRCHYCGYTSVMPEVCPQCSSRTIRYFGAGTQKVEEEVRQIFRESRVLRMDGDSTTRRGAHAEILERFQNGGADILIGTQMIAKGLDLPGVTLVGVINADTTLFMPDFRAAERTFQLLTQVAGRAGRGSVSGEVIVQTYSPEHYSIVAASGHDYHSFVQNELPVRRALGYPPFNYLARLLLTHESEEGAKEGALFLKGILENKAAGNDIQVLGPAPALLSRIKNMHRWQVILKGPRIGSVRAAIKEGLDELEKKKPAGFPNVNVDLNPQGMT